MDATRGTMQPIQGHASYYPSTRVLHIHNQKNQAAPSSPYFHYTKDQGSLFGAEFTGASCHVKAQKSWSKLLEYILKQDRLTTGGLLLNEKESGNSPIIDSFQAKKRRAGE